MAKVNFGTYLKQRYLEGRREPRSAANVVDPHRLLGMGGPEDVLVAGRRAVRDAVLERIDVLGCRGKAQREERNDGMSRCACPTWVRSTTRSRS